MESSKYTDADVCAMTRKAKPDFMKHGPYRVRYRNEKFKHESGTVMTRTTEAVILDLRTAKIIAIFPSPQGDEVKARDAMNMGWLLCHQEETGEESDAELAAPYGRAVIHNYSLVDPS